MNQSPSSQPGSDGAGFDLSQFHAIFFEEAGENLANMEGLLLDVDIDAPDDEQLNAIFRCAHSIKGGAATFGFADVVELTHVMEALLDRLRRHELVPTSAMVDTLLESGDALRALLGRHRDQGDEELDFGELVDRIRALTEGAAATAGAQVAASAEPAPRAEAPAPAVAGAAPVSGKRRLAARIGPLARAAIADQLVELFHDIPGLGEIEAADAGELDDGGYRHFSIVTETPDEELLDLFAFHVDRSQVSLRLADEGPDGAHATGEGAEAHADGWGLFEGPAKQGAAGTRVEPAGAAPSGDTTADAASGASRPPAAPPGGAGSGRRADRATRDASTLRVSVEKVDQLINIVGELVITQAMLAQTGRDLDPIVHQQMMSCLVDLERNTRLLQESVMAIRMIPMALVFNRFPRMLRDLTAKLGKRVELQTVGEATELDKGMVEKITDPLTHLVRNAADHGIEMPEDRIAAGKNPVGRITLSAQHRGGSILIEVQDDGRGLGRERILAKARERGIPVSDSMSDGEVFALVFEPGFSTASEVTDVSGRGVGMDVVRRNIQSLGGSVEIDSAEGYGTRVSVRLPLTLAIMDGMSVGVSTETYIVPLGSVVESINLEPSMIRSVGGVNQILEVRDEFLPVVSLQDFFAVPRAEESARGNSTVIVVEAEGQRVALLVDELIGQHQVVVKNLEANYRKVPGISGATIMGDGRVALILDVAHLVRRARH